jgi:hypothetical protein
LIHKTNNNVILDATNYIAENNNMGEDGVKITKRAHKS